MEESKNSEYRQCRNEEASNLLNINGEASISWRELILTSTVNIGNMSHILVNLQILGSSES